MEATHKISAVYHPCDDLIELTWENLSTGDVATLTTQVDRDDGKAIIDVVSPSVYHNSVTDSKRSYVRIDDMVWPNYRLDDLDWQLRYGRDEDVIKSRMLLASIVSAYQALIEMPQKRRNEICKAIKSTSL